VESPEELLSELATTDALVATRFHNVVLALLLTKPAIAISFHHKCASLMDEMGMARYCHDINHLNADQLIQCFCELEKNAEVVKTALKEKTAKLRKTLDEQYDIVFRGQAT
jgi:polysaccharide pyruvyl transferase WcaK-like protein